MLAAIGAIALAAAAAFCPGTAVAAFPGENGRIAYAEERGDFGQDIFTIFPDGSGVRQLTSDSAVDIDPSWSADGRRLVFTRLPKGAKKAQLSTMDADGGDLTPIIGTSDPYDASPSFSPNGHRIAYATERSIRTVRIDGTDAHRLVSGGELRDPQYSPSGNRIAFAGRLQGKKKAGIWTIRRDGSRLRRLTSRRNDGGPDYSPDGRQIVFGRYSYGDNHLRVIPADGSPGGRIYSTSAVFYFPAFAPEGDRMVVTVCDLPSRYCSCSELYTMSPAGSDRQRITDGCDFTGSLSRALSASWQPLPGSP